jgi:hypothetical protein
MIPEKPIKILSGGQTGADRAALDWAIRNSVPHGGWCPKGRTAEDGRIDDKYRLQETPSWDYDQRTEWNVRDADGTALFTLSGILSGGTLFTAQCAKKLKKPCVHIKKTDKSPCLKLLQFIKKNNVKTLNIAGPRAVHQPGIEAFVQSVLERAFQKETE